MYRRYEILALLGLLSMITYLDRACFGAAGKLIAGEFGLTGTEGLRDAITAFTISYAIFEIPCGWWGDRTGPKKILIRIVLWWSFFTLLTGWVGVNAFGRVWGTVTTLIIVRFLFGMGEAGAYPNMTRAIHNWFPTTEWGRAQGIIWMAGRLAGGLTPLFWAFLVVGTDWTKPLLTYRGAFTLFAVLGVVWCIVFAWRFTDHPPTESQSPKANHELEQKAPAKHEPTPWKDFLLSGNLWLLCIMYFCHAYGWFFNISYLPTYMNDRFALDEKSLLVALYKGGPLWFGAFACIFGGIISDTLVRLFHDRRVARRFLCVTGYGIGAACLLGSLWMETATTFFLCVSIAAFCGDLTIASNWATCQDIGGKYSGTASAWMNTIGTAGAACAAWLTGTLVNMNVDAAAVAQKLPKAELPKAILTQAQLAGYDQAIFTFGIAFAISAACWLLINADKPIVRS